MTYVVESDFIWWKSESEQIGVEFAPKTDNAK